MAGRRNKIKILPKLKDEVALQREANGEDNVWLIKPAQGSHSAGMCLTADAVTVVLNPKPYILKRCGIALC